MAAPPVANDACTATRAAACPPVRTPLIASALAAASSRSSFISTKRPASICT
jgi:hypothetical protein